MMKKMFCLSIIFLTLSGFAFAENYDVKNVCWGMTKDDVIKSELSAPVETNAKSLVFADILDNKECNIVYFFQDNQLYCTCYNFTTDYVNNNDFITDLGAIKQFLTQKYGKPNSDDTLVNDNSTRDDLQNRELAISMGRLKYRTIWETLRSKITLWLFGEDSQKARLYPAMREKQRL